MRSQGWWVQKLPGSSLAGIPDWIQGHVDHGLVFTEAKTLEAVLRAPRRRLAEQGSPRAACSRAQAYFLDQVERYYPGHATVLVLGDCGHHWDIPWRGAHIQVQHVGAGA